MKMRKRIFAILTCIIVVFNLILFVLPSFAFDGTTWYLQFSDQEASQGYQLEFNQTEDAYAYRFEYTLQDSKLDIYAVYLNSENLLYTCMIPYGYTVDVTIQCDGDYDLNQFSIGFPLTQTVTGTLTPNYNFVMVTLEFKTVLYTYSDVEDSYRDGYSAGIAASNSNVDTIYGQGYEAGKADGYTLGLEDSKTGLGLTNVTLSSLYYTFTYLLGQLSIFGVSLGSILVSVAFIFLIYFIFKVVKG